MPSNYKTPGVYVEEISLFPPSVAQVETAIPAFIGYTVNETHKGESLTNNPKRLKSYKEYLEIFGAAPNPSISVTTVDGVLTVDSINRPDPFYYMNDALRMYFANGGGPCYVCSLGSTIAATIGDIKDAIIDGGLGAIKKEDEPTIIVFPDAPRLLDTDSTNFYEIYKQALLQCAELGDRVVLIDLHTNGTFNNTFEDIKDDFRGKIGVNDLKYGAAYYPWIQTSLTFELDETSLVVTGGGIAANSVLKKEPALPGDELPTAETDLSIYHAHPALYADIKKALAKEYMIMPPAAAVAGIYATVDRTRGVWKAPANVSLNYVKSLMVKFDDEDQKDMNVTTSGKSVNALRKFTGKGNLVWGARTLAGNDNEWKYISVRRFFNMVEESVKKATEQFVFEPNDANTWVKVRAMIENFLTLQWQAGALAGAKPEDAFYVRVGLGQTMTADDILNGRMIVEIGMAAVRPAEFIILKFMHKMQVS